MRQPPSSSARRAHQRLELHRGLAFIVLHLADAEQAGGGVEQPAGTGGGGEMTARQQCRQHRRRGAIGKARRDVLALPDRRKRRRRHPPRLARGDVAAGQRQRREMTEPREPCTLDAQQFAAPIAAVAAEPMAVEHQAQERRVDAMFGGDRRDMGVRDAARRSAAGRDFRRSAWRQNRRCRSCATTTGFVSSIAIRCATVSSKKRIVSGDDRSPICCETNASRPRVIVTVFLRRPPTASTGRDLARQFHRPRHETARAADEAGRTVDHHRHAVVGAHHDGAIVADDQVGDAREPTLRRRRSRSDRRRNWRWSPPARNRPAPVATPAPPARRRPRETADDAAAYRAASRRHGSGRAPPTAPARRGFAAARSAARLNVSSARSAVVASTIPSSDASDATITANGLASRPLRRRNSITAAALRASHSR